MQPSALVPGANIDTFSVSWSGFFAQQADYPTRKIAILGKSTRLMIFTAGR